MVGKKLTTALLLISITLSCSPPTDQKNGPAAAVQTRTFIGIGVVASVKPEVAVVELNHEEIKGLMPAMQMEFHVKDKSLLNGLASGDRIEFTLENSVSGMVITGVRKI